MKRGYKILDDIVDFENELKGLIFQLLALNQR
jgi:hypothetical protein